MNEGWIELPRAEVLNRIEQMLTVDAVSIELELTIDPTPVGFVRTFTLVLNEDSGAQAPVLLALKDPVNTDGPARWFVNERFVNVESNSS